MNALQHCSLKCFAARGGGGGARVTLNVFSPSSYFHISFSHSAFEHCFIAFLISLYTL